MRASGAVSASLAALATLACREPATPPARPLKEFPFATASSDCAPWDGPAVSVLLTPTAQSGESVAAPFLRVTLYDSRERVARRTIRWPGDAEVGGASWCRADDDCVAADSGAVRLEVLEGDSVLPGRLRLVFAGHAPLEGSFRAAWRPRVTRCG